MISNNRGYLAGRRNLVQVVSNRSRGLIRGERPPSANLLRAPAWPDINGESS